MASIPVVDLRAFTAGSPRDRQDFVRAFGDGLAEFGFVTLDGHGVAAECVENAFAQARAFFALPEADKLRCVVPASHGNRGYIPFGREKAVGARAADLKEFFHVGQPHIRAEHRAVYQPNVWPDAPTASGLERAALDLYASLERCALTALRAVALYLELPEGHFADMATDGNSILRMIHYPPVGPDAPPGAVRAAAHEDINLVTLLVESTAGGLEILTRNGQWVPVHALAGQVVLDAGDMLQLCTNGRIPATTHRVVNPRGPDVERYSMPFFTHPRPEVLLAPAPGTVTAERAARYEPLRAQEFLAQRLKAIGA